MHVILLRERSEAAFAEADRVLADVDRAVAANEIDDREASDLRADLVLSEISALRAAKRDAEALRLLESAPHVAKSRFADVEKERIEALAALGRRDEAFARALEVLRDPPNVGSRRALAEAIWRVGDGLGRTRELLPLVRALDHWCLGDEPFWYVRRALVYSENGDAKRALDSVASARKIVDFSPRFDDVERLIESRTPVAKERLRELDAALTPH